MASKASEITPEIVAEHGLSESEYEIILERLGREPNMNELGIFSVMWSEHCSYKSSRRHLAKFLTKGKRVIQGPGENAGVIDIDDGGMLEPGDRFAFNQEALAEGLVDQKRRVHNLERHLALERHLFSQIDGCHAAMPHLFFYYVSGDIHCCLCVCACCVNERQKFSTS